MSKEDSSNYGMEGFRNFIRNKIKYQREQLNFDEMQTEASFYSDMKVLCQEYYNDMNLNDEGIIKEVNTISDMTRNLIKKRIDAINVQVKEYETSGTKEIPKALPTSN